MGYVDLAWILIRREREGGRERRGKEGRTK